VLISGSVSHSMMSLESTVYRNEFGCEQNVMMLLRHHWVALESIVHRIEFGCEQNVMIPLRHH